MLATHTNNRNWRDNLKQLKEMLKLLLPKGKSEITLFIVFFLIYGSLAIFMALGTNITDQIASRVDAYLAFDSQVISHKGYTYLLGHPLITIFTRPLIYIGIFLNVILQTTKAKAVFLVIMCSYFTASSNVFVYRYLKDVLNLKQFITILLILLYSLFSMNVILSFTFESFTFSLYFLTFSIYYYSYYIKNNIRVSFINSLLLAIFIGGITITNFIKGLVPILFVKESPLIIIKKIVYISIIFLCLVSYLLFMPDSLIEYNYRVTTFIINDNEISRYIISYLWGTPILLPQVIQTYVAGSDTFAAIYVDFYQYWWQYTTVIAMGLLVAMGIILNYKNRLIYIPILYLAIDFIIHIIFKYGINEGMIYAGHWMFVIPIFIGWLYRSLNKKQSYILSILIVILATTILINNTIQMSNFVRLALELFPVS